MDIVRGAKGEGGSDGRRIDDELEKARRGESPVISGLGQQLSRNPGGVRQQVINRAAPKKVEPTIIDVRTKPPVLKQATGEGGPVLLPVRTVVYIEVGDMDSVQVWELCRQYSISYQGSVHGPHYVVAVRNGRLRSEMEFEAQILETVKEICEVDVNGEIILKGGAREVQVMRTHVGLDE